MTSHEKTPTCGLCGIEYERVDKAAACEDAHRWQDSFRYRCSAGQPEMPEGVEHPYEDVVLASDEGDAS